MIEKPASQKPAAAKLAERQLRNWELTQSQQPLRSSGSGATVFDFVTVANNVGGGGGELAAQLAKRLHWPLFDRDILTEMAGNDELRSRLYKAMDERDLNWFESAMRSFLHSDLKREDYFHRLTETILFLARKGPAVFVGRASDLILPTTKGVRVKIVASLEHRIANFARANGLTLKVAARDVGVIERARARFIQKHFHREINDPARFDLLINIERVSSREAIDVILSLLKERKIID
ncbi:MAG: cytidylate kinase-like family protein [Phycisphaerae bacterium]|nr:cytidylate kinase-like family protein [Phycisphaerae bacterium]